MHNEFTAIIEQDGEWFIAFCPEIPGASGQGRTRDEARDNLSGAIALILDDRREDALRGVPEQPCSKNLQGSVDSRRLVSTPP
jgi:predicted RNase H-like HicB family nuclease